MYKGCKCLVYQKYFRFFTVKSICYSTYMVFSDDPSFFKTFPISELFLAF